MKCLNCKNDIVGRSHFCGGACSVSFERANRIKRYDDIEVVEIKQCVYCGRDTASQDACCQQCLGIKLGFLVVNC